MEEIEIKNSTITHKNESLNRLDLSFLKHIDLKEYKTCNLLAYWITDFSNYHDEEKNFDYSKSGVFSRGEIVKVNLGFNVGHELGGLHYCVILNKYDNTRNGTLNVVPLTSRKPNKQYNSNTVNLGNELYCILNENLMKEKERLNKVISNLEQIENTFFNVQNVIKNEEIYIKNLEREILKMKQDSIALIGQITTISKQRIHKDFLIRRVKLSDASLDLIDKQIIKILTK